MSLLAVMVGVLVSVYVFCVCVNRRKEVGNGSVMLNAI